jgi:hypothetical protein
VYSFWYSGELSVLSREGSREDVFRESETDGTVHFDRQRIVRDVAIPSFFVVGPPRTGTSWLHDVLSDHVNLPAPTKETRFFDLNFHRGWKWYFDHFADTGNGRMVGEVAPTYFASGAARNLIARWVPDAKIVFIFRNPIERLVSLYRLKLAYGTLACSFDVALERDPELLESSMYASTLREWKSIFPQRRLSINFYDDLSHNPRGFVEDLASFLNIPRFALHESRLAQIYSTKQMTEPRSYLATKAATAMADWCKARKLDNVVAAVKNSSLIKLFLGGGAPFSDIPVRSLRKASALLLRETEELEAMIGRDLTAWKPLTNGNGTTIR